jgi:Zn-dependent metalloprotease
MKVRSARRARLALVLAAVALAAAGAPAAEAPRVTLRPLPSAPRLSAPPATGGRGDPRAARLRATVERARESVAAGQAARARERDANARGQRELQTALERLRARAGGAVEVKMDPRRRLPRMLRGRLQAATAAGPGATRAERTARAFLRDQRALLRLADPDAELALAREQRDELGRTHLRFRQRHRGVPVLPGELLVHLDGRGDVDVVNGTWAETPELAVAPALTAEAAVAQARAEIAGALDAPIPAPELIVWAPGDRPARLAWSVFVPATVSAQWRVVLDAATGARLDAWNTAMDADVVGSGLDLLGALRAMHVWSEAGTHFLVDASKAMFDPTSDPPDPDASRGAITILDAQHQPPTSDPQSIPSLFHVTSTSANGPWLADGVSALVNFSAVYDYYLAAHGRDSLDDQGGSILAIVRLGQDFQNAFFLSEQNLMAFGDAQPYAAALDVVGHELTHGVTFHSANLIYRDEPGALNESMSDIFGEMVEASVNGAPDWLVGSELSAPLRSMSNPGSLTVFGAPYPSHYSQYRRLGNVDSGGVHVNSSIVNHAFFQLAAGLVGNGIGIADAARIFYRALTVYLTANARFVDARLACVQAAADLFGAGSNQEQRVRQAFDAVGIVDGTGTPPPTPFPGTEGDDSTLFLRSELGTYFLYRLEPDLDGGTPFPLSFFDVGDKRPAITGDGSLAWFVDSLDDLCFIATDGSESQETCSFDLDPESSLQGQVASVAVSPSGDVYGFVLRDLFTGERLNEITIIDVTADPPDDVRTYTLDAPVTVPTPGGGISIATVEFADALEITADDEMVVYDALNILQLASGGAVEVWSIYALDRASGNIFAIVPPQPGVDVGYPALAQRSDGFLVFDAVDVASGIGVVLAGNLSTGALTPIATGIDGFSVPGYSGDDTRVIYSFAAATETGFSLRAQTVAGRVTPQGAPVPWITDGDYSTVYRRGPFVPEPGAGTLAAAAALALAALARRRAR